MGFMDELKKLTQPYDDEEDFFEDADVKYKPQQTQAAATSAQMEFENTFADEPASAPEPAAPRKPAGKSGFGSGEGGSIFGNLGLKKPSKPKPRERSVNFGGSETQVILFNPKSFDEAGELVNHLNQYRSVLMTLEGIPNDMARRLLDFLSGITFALQGKITPVSAKTYFVTPHNVDILGTSGDQPVSDEQYF